MKHSKGPWFTSETSETYQSFGFGYRIENTESKTYLASVNGVTENETCKANAKLIAASPELLENLIRCVDRLEENGMGGMSAVARAKKAIKNAIE